jgi:Holliday junction resolvasome RuvABC endonuclease subunit
MKVVGLDLSLLSTGVCVLEGDAGCQPTHRCVLFPGEKATTIEGKVVRLESICKDIVGLVGEEAPDIVGIEAPAKSQPWQAAAIGELHGVVKLQLYLAYGIIPVIPQVNTIRKAVVGKIDRTLEEVTDGKGKKKRKWSYGRVPGKSGKLRRATIKDVIERILGERGLLFPSHDEMDAYVVARYCWNQAVTPAGCVVDEKEDKEDEGPQSGMA